MEARVRYGLSDRVALTRARTNLAALDELDSLWTSYVEDAEPDDFHAERQTLIELADSLAEVLAAAPADVARIRSAVEATRESEIDAALDAIGDRYPEARSAIEAALADVLSEYSLRGLVIEACQYLEEELPIELRGLIAQRARLQADERPRGDISKSAKCALAVALMGAGLVDVAIAGGATTLVVYGAAKEVAGFALGWGADCRSVAKSIWSRFR